MAEEASFKAKVVKGFFWLSVGTFAGQFISWISTIIVIRLLHPADYGLMAMAASFISLLTVLSELGVGGALVQAEQITERQVRQIHGFVILSSVVALLACHAVAPLVASFYHEPKLVLPVRVLNINFIFIALYVVPQAQFIREMNFRSKAKIDIASQIGSSLLTLLLALSGAGVWSLVAGMLMLNALRAAGYNRARSGWLRPVFDHRGSEHYIRYGVTLTGSRMLYTLYGLADTVIVGRFLGQTVLGIYAVALNLASMPAEKVLPLINQITFTSYSRIQNDLDRVRKNLLMTTRTLAFAGFPLFFGMASVAPDGIPLILGPKWASIVTPFQLLCIIVPFKALSPNVNSTLNAIGKVRANLVNTAVTGVILVGGFLFGVRFGILGVCFAWLLAYPLAFVITMSYSLNILGITWSAFLAAIRFPVLASLLMAAAIFAVRGVTAKLPPALSLALLIGLGVACYLGMTYIFKRDEYREMRNLVRI